MYFIVVVRFNHLYSIVQINNNNNNGMNQCFFIIGFLFLFFFPTKETIRIILLPVKNPFLPHNPYELRTYVRTTVIRYVPRYRVQYSFDLEYVRQFTRHINSEQLLFSHTVPFSTVQEIILFLKKNGAQSKYRQ